MAQTEKSSLRADVVRFAPKRPPDRKCRLRALTTLGLMRSLDLEFLGELAAAMVGTPNPPHQSCRHLSRGDLNVSRTSYLSGLLGLAAALLAVQASAQAPEPGFPTRAIKIISASPAGGGVDLSARIIADQLQKLWGHPGTGEKRTGGSNNIAG